MDPWTEVALAAAVAVAGQLRRVARLVLFFRPRPPSMALGRQPAEAHGGAPPPRRLRGCQLE